MERSILAPSSPDQGFNGVVWCRIDPDTAWRKATIAISVATGASAEGARDFLDSQYGCCSADDLCCEIEPGLKFDRTLAIVMESWCNERIPRATSCETGIPSSFSHLTGFALYFTRIAEAKGKSS